MSASGPAALRVLGAVVGVLGVIGRLGWWSRPGLVGGGAGVGGGAVVGGDGRGGAVAGWRRPGRSGAWARLPARTGAGPAAGPGWAGGRGLAAGYPRSAPRRSAGARAPGWRTPPGRPARDGSAAWGLDGAARCLRWRRRSVRRIGTARCGCGAGRRRIRSCGGSGRSWWRHALPRAGAGRLRRSEPGPYPDPLSPRPLRLLIANGKSLKAIGSVARPSHDHVRKGSRTKRRQKDLSADRQDKLFRRPRVIPPPGCAPRHWS